MTAPSIVQLIRPGDEADVFDFFCLAQADNGFFPMSSRKVIDVILKAVKHDGVSIGVIRGVSGIEAASGLAMETYWYSDTPFLNELLNFVHPDHRRSKHADAILQFQKDMSDLLSVELGFKVPVFPGILTRERLEPKMRMYKRKFKQVGAIFAHNADEFYAPDRIDQKPDAAPRKKANSPPGHA